MNEDTKFIIAMALLFPFIVGLITWGAIAESKKICITEETTKKGVVVDTYEKVWKDIVFTGYVGSTRKAIIEFEDKTRIEVNADGLIKGDTYEEKYSERKCN